MQLIAGRPAVVAKQRSPTAVARQCNFNGGDFHDFDGCAVFCVFGLGGYARHGPNGYDVYG